MVRFSLRQVWKEKTDRRVEIIGHAVKVGSKVTTVKVGDRVGVGAQISACLECDACKEDNETYCKKLLGMFTIFLARKRY
jgi:D-arabinose 1-dehydrogenase-like Zn-dependent alcohol dehydrogenase